MYILFLFIFLMSGSLHALKYGADMQVANPQPGESLQHYRFIKPCVVNKGEKIFVGDTLLVFKKYEELSEDDDDFFFSDDFSEEIDLYQGEDLEGVMRSDLCFARVKKVSYTFDGSPVYTVFNGTSTYQVLRDFIYSVNMVQINRKKVKYYG